MRWPWDELGIEPTADAVDIKRAYAKRLKNTRPDDDAAAYQLLREAYDAALDWARAQRATGMPTMPVPAIDDATDAQQANVAAIASEALPLAPVDAFTALSFDDDATWPASDDGFSDSSKEAQVPPEDVSVGVSDETPPEFTSPEAIARGVYGYWSEHGDEALVALWPRVRHDLDALPLALRSDASNWMATLVLDCPELPGGFVLPLAAYFGWRDDFRVAALVGPGRAHALHERLHALGLRGKSDPSLLHRFRDARALAELLRHGKVWRARLLAMLMSGGTAERTPHELGEFLDAIDLRRDEGSRIGNLITLHWIARISGLFALFLLLRLFSTESGAWIAPVESGIAVMAGALMVFSGFIHFGMMIGFERLVPETWRQWRTEWPRVAAMVALFGTVGVAAWGFTMPANTEAASAWQFLGGWALIMLLPLINWPSGRTWWAPLLLPMTVVLTVMLRGLFPEHSVLASFALAQAWVLAASALLVHRTGEIVALYRNPFVWLRPTNALGWIVVIVFIKGVAFFVAALCIITLPLTVFVSTLRHGMVAGFATLACACVIATGISEGDDLPLALLLSLILAVWLMAGLRWVAGKLADRLRP